MKTELLQPAATLVAAFLSTENIRSGVRPPTNELFVQAYRKLEQAVEQIEREDQAKAHQPLVGQRHPEHDQSSN